MNNNSSPDEISNHAVIANDIGYIKRDIAEIKLELSGKFVTQKEFAVVQKIVFGEVALILVAVLSAIIYGVVTH